MQLATKIHAHGRHQRCVRAIYRALLADVLVFPILRGKNGKLFSQKKKKEKKRKRLT